MYSIKQAAEICGITSHTLRYYERAKVLPMVGRNAGGHRRFSESDLGWIRFVTLLKSTGMSLSNIRDFVEAEQAGADGVPVKLRVLNDHRDYIDAQMKQMRTFRKKLDEKIAYYGNK